MNGFPLPMAAALLVGLFISVGLAFYAISQRSARGALPLGMILTASACWLVCYGFELRAVTLDSKLTWYVVKTIFTTLLPSILLLFSLDYTHRTHWINWRILVLLAIEPVAILALLWTNSLHKLYYFSVSVEEFFNGLTVLMFEFSVGYYAHVIYSYLVIVVAISVVMVQYLRAPRLFRRQAAMVMIGILLPAAAGLLAMAYPSVVQYIEIVPLTLAFSLPIVAVGVFRYQLPDSMPIAREHILDNIKDAVILLDAKARILDINLAAKKILGDQGKIAIGKPLQTLAPSIARLLPDKDPARSFRTEIALENGVGRRIYEVRGTPINAGDGRVSGRLLLLDDITDRNQAQQFLRESENRFRSVVELLPDGLSIHYDGKIVYANLTFARMVGAANPEQLIGRNVLEFVHPEYHEIVFERMLETYAGRPVSPMIQKMVGLDGQITITEVVSIPASFKGKTFAHVIHRDLTEKLRAEEEQRLQVSALNAAANTIVITDRTGKVIWINPAFTHLTGYTNEEIGGRNLRILNSGHHDLAFYQNLWETILSGKVWRDQIINRKKDGSLYVEDMTITPVSNQKGEISHFVAVKYDVTERNRAEEALRASENLYRTTIDAIDDMIYVVDADYRFTLYNSTFLKWLQENHLAEGDVLGQSLSEILPFLTEDHLSQYRQVYESGSTLVTQELTEINGNHIMVETRKSLVHADDKPPRFVTVVRDISDLNRRQREREAIIEVAAAMRELNQRSELLEVLLKQLNKLLDSEASSVVLRNAATGHLSVELATGKCAHLSGQDVQGTTSASHQVMAGGKLYVNNQTLEQPGILQQELLQGVKAIAGAPLMASRQVIGVLWVGRARDWTDSELRILNAVADMAANAIQRTTLHEQTQHRLEQLQALQVVDQAITSSLDLRVILDILLEKVTTQLRVDAADILLYDASTEMLRFAARRGFQTQSTQRSYIRLGEGNAGRVVLERKIIAIPDIREGNQQELSYRLMASEGFVTYYGVPLTARGQVQGVLQIFHRTPFEAGPEWLDFLQALSGQAAVAIDNAMLFDGMRKANLDLRRAYDETIEGWALALEYRDQETEGHSRRVTELTVRLAEYLGVSGEDLLNIRRGAILHDIGKMGIPDNILQKPGPLTDSEREIMKQHPVYAYKMLSTIDFLLPALDIPYCHHEYWDGTGYPMSLKGEEIPLAARIFAIVDVWDALNFDRPYRPAWEKEKVVEYVQGQSGKQFDPQVVQAFFKMLEEESAASSPE